MARANNSLSIIQINSKRTDAYVKKKTNRVTNQHFHSPFYPLNLPSNANKDITHHQKCTTAAVAAVSDFKLLLDPYITLHITYSQNEYIYKLYVCVCRCVKIVVCGGVSIIEVLPSTSAEVLVNLRLPSWLLGQWTYQCWYSAECISSVHGSQLPFTRPSSRRRRMSYSAIWMRKNQSLIQVTITLIDHHINAWEDLRFSKEGGVQFVSKI